mmetsp:Transcript_20984/g.44294  ORF Transcript_20984/g.44294 Transcript_20984/m.44294 type:complete len:113 (-) Transcript_20984:108-446(-)
MVESSLMRVVGGTSGTVALTIIIDTVRLLAQSEVALLQVFIPCTSWRINAIALTSRSANVSRNILDQHQHCSQVEDDVRSVVHDDVKGWPRYKSYNDGCGIVAKGALPKAMP